MFVATHKFIGCGESSPSPQSSTSPIKHVRLSDFLQSLLHLLILLLLTASDLRIKASVHKIVGMSGPGAGFEYPPQEVSWLKRYLSYTPSKRGSRS